MLLVVVAVVAPAAPAFAHAVLESTDPVDSSIYPTAAPPTTVTLRWGEPVGLQLGAIRLYDDLGRLVQTGAPHHPSGDDAAAVMSLPHLGPGTYVVSWRVISADTHPVSGAFSFTVGARRHDVSGVASKALSTAHGSRTVGVLYGIIRFALFTSVLVLLGGIAILAVVWPAGRRSRRAAVVLWTALGVALAASLVGIAIEGIYAAAFPLRELFDSTVLSDTLHARYGETALARIVLLLAAIPITWKLLASREPHDEPRRLPAWWLGLMSLVGIGTIVTLTLASHATSGRWTAAAEPADVVHVGAAALWFGGLMLVAVALVPHATTNALSRTLPRFSALATGAIVVIVASGAFQALRQVGTFHALADTGYGRLLIVKVSVFAVLLLVALCSHRIARLFRRSGGTAESVGPLRRALALEVALGLAILVVTALLVDARPAFEIEHGPQSFTVTSPSNQPPVVAFSVVVEPATSGLNQIHLTTETPQGSVANPQQLSFELTNTKHNLGPLRVPLNRLGPGHYLGNYVIPFAGTWRVDIRALMTPIDEAFVSHTIRVR